MADKTLSEIVAYELERIAFEGAVFSEATVTLQIHPLTFLQLIAWSGVAYLDEHENSSHRRLEVHSDERIGGFARAEGLAHFRKSRLRV
jgi:hypothetical protein